MCSGVDQDAANSPVPRRVVVKIGSRALAQSPHIFSDIASATLQCRAHDSELVVVSSGAVRFGVTAVAMDQRPTELAKIRATASVGQPLLMDTYREACAPHGIALAQLLLTHADFRARDRYLNARATLESLLEMQCLPIVNGNDALGSAELEFGDNDQLAAMVATLVEADLLVLLSSVEGLMAADGTLIPQVNKLDDALAHVREDKTEEGLGGMQSKLEAAFRAAEGGVPVVLGSAFEKGLLQRIIAGEAHGTRVEARRERLRARKHWLAFATSPAGTIVVDKGAVRALQDRHASLLGVGVVGVRGRFEAGDVVKLEDTRGTEIARGIARVSLAELARSAGQERDAALPGESLKTPENRVIVHRDDLVLFDRVAVGPRAT